VVLVVGLDTANAFNSLPWSVIQNALSEKGVPRYLERVLHSYLSDMLRPDPRILVFFILKRRNLG